MDRIEILKTSVAQRQEEIFCHQINVDNYRRAIAKISTLTIEKQFLLRDFVTDLETRLANEELEQLKSIVILQVLQDQINESALGDVADLV